MGTHSCRYCALSGLGGQDIAGGVCFKNPTGGDLRRTDIKKNVKDDLQREGGVRRSLQRGVLGGTFKKKQDICGSE